MPKPTLSIDSPELFGVTESSITLAFEVTHNGSPTDAGATIRIDGDVRAESAGPGTRLVRIEDLPADTELRVEISTAEGARAEPGRYFPGVARTLPRPAAPEVASFATMNDLHFGESRIGGVLTDDHEYGEATSEFPAVADEDYDTPYAEFMNADAVAEINRTGVDLTIIKGDIADRGLPEQFETAARTFAGFDRPHHAFLGNHDYLEVNNGRDVDGYALLGQERAPRTVALGGFQLVLLDTVIPGEHDGGFGTERREWLADALAETRSQDVPTILLSHHHPVPPEHRNSYPNSIGMDPQDSLLLFDLLGDAPQVKGMLIGHTHRNRVRRYAAAGDIPFAEVNNTKDYPGGFAHYRLFADGSFRQEVRRTSSSRALAHSMRCRSLFKGQYRHFTMGSLAERCYVAG